MNLPFPPDRIPADDASRLVWLRLARSRNVGPRTFIRLLNRFRDARAAFVALPGIAASAGAGNYAPCAPEAAEAEMEAGARAGARMLCLGAPDYPSALAAIADPPPLMWALGNPALAARPCLAIVGARNASAAGARIAATLARDLGEAGWVTVSGLARGIDRAAHAAALDFGTIAVLAGGVDDVYPAENAALHGAIAARGLLLSEAPMGETPVARSFPRRNRIVAGLSSGVVLVEAAERSGSLITARLAIEQGREAMAVPGSPLDPRAAGCNALIREGAALIRSAEDVLEALSAPRAPGLPAFASHAPAAQPAPDDASVERVAALLTYAAIPFDDLCRAAALSPAALSSALLDLDLAGRIERRPGDMIALAPSPG